MTYRTNAWLKIMVFVALLSAWAGVQASQGNANQPSQDKPPQEQPSKDKGDSGKEMDNSNRVSPHNSTECSIAGQKVTIEYGRPYMKGRKIMGGLVPYGKVWRTGADEATTLKTPVALMIGDAKVPAGTYTLYTLPSAGTWKLIINKETGQWGTVYHQAQDLARVDMKKSEITVPVEQFTIALDQDTNDSADLILEWEKTRLTVLVKAAQ